MVYDFIFFDCTDSDWNGFRFKVIAGSTTFFSTTPAIPYVSLSLYTNHDGVLQAFEKIVR